MKDWREVADGSEEDHENHNDNVDSDQWWPPEGMWRCVNFVDTDRCANTMKLQELQNEERDWYPRAEYDD